MKMGYVTGNKTVRTLLTGVLLGASLLTLSASAFASGGSNSGGTSTSATDSASGTIIKLDNFNTEFNGIKPKGQVSLGYGADGSAQSMSFSLSNLNVPDNTILPVNVITGVYKTIFSYYSYQILEYTVAPGTLKVSRGSVSLLLSTQKGDVIPSFSLPTVGTTEVQVFSPDGTILILDGSAGKLRA